MSPSAANTGFIRPLTDERALLWGLLASIALHAVVLLVLSLSGAQAPPAKTLLVLTARLVPFAAATRAPEAPHPEPAPAPRPAPTKPAVEPTRKPASAAVPRETAPAEPVMALEPESAPVASGPAASPPQPAAPAAAGQTQAAGSVPAAEPAAKSGDAVDAGTLEQYRLALIAATRRYKRYPAIALEKGLQGRVEVHMVIGANGMVAGTSIKAGSGHEVLDKQAVNMLKKGKTTVPIPAGLRGREFSIDIPVVFNLDNPNS